MKELYTIHGLRHFETLEEAEKARRLLKNFCFAIQKETCSVILDYRVKVYRGRSSFYMLITQDQRTTMTGFVQDNQYWKIKITKLDEPVYYEAKSLKKTIYRVTVQRDFESRAEAEAVCRMFSISCTEFEVINQ